MNQMMMNQITIQFDKKEQHLMKKLSLAGQLLQFYNSLEGLDEVIVAGDWIRTVAYTCTGDITHGFQFDEASETAKLMYISVDGKVDHLVESTYVISVHG